MATWHSWIPKLLSRTTVGLSCLAAALPPTAALARADPVHPPAGAIDRRGPPNRFDDIDVRNYGAKGDGTTDDTAAFEAAIAFATDMSRPPTSNSGAKIRIPCGKYILNAKLKITTGPNAAIGFYGDTASCTELQWNVADGGLDFELPQQFQTSPSRSRASPAAGLSVAVDVEHLSLVNNAPGNVFTGTALRISQPIPTRSITSGSSDQTIFDIRWYANAPGLGGRNSTGQGWNVGIELVETPFAHINHVSGTQWSNQGVAPLHSVGIHLVSTGNAKDYYMGQAWITDYFNQGAYRAIGIDGHNIQGVYASGLNLGENGKTIDWEAPTQDASASFTLTNSSLNGVFSSIYLNNVRQVMINNTEILAGNWPTPLAENYYGIHATNADNILLTNNVLIPSCSGCARHAIDARHKGYGIYVEHDTIYDNQASVITGNSIAYGDVGVHAAGAQILVADNAIAAPVISCIEDGSASIHASSHPDFENNQCGATSVTIPTGIRQFVGNQSNAGTSSFQANGPTDLVVTAKDRAEDAYTDLGRHARSSIDLTGATNASQALAMSAATTSNGALRWYAGANQATPRWGSLYADQARGSFHESFPALSFDVGGHAGSLVMTSTAITAAVPVGLRSYPMAQLPAHCVAGQTAFVSDGRNPGEAAAAGTGTTAFCNTAAHWFATSSGRAVTR